MKTNPKYRKLIETATAEFSRYGMVKVSVEEICRKANVSKATFYKFFENKEVLVEKILDRIYTESLQEFEEIFADKEISFEGKIEKLILLKQKYSDEMGHTFVEDILTSPELGKYFQSKIIELNKIHEDFLQQGKKENMIRSDLSLPLFQIILAGLQQMVGTDSFAKLIPDLHQRTRFGVELLFYGLTDPQKKGANK